MIGQDADMSAAPIRRQAARVRCQVRSCARSIRHRLPSLRPSPLPSTPSAAAPRGFVRALHRYYEARPTPRLFHGSFGSSPSCRGPGSLRATAGQTRSPRFRRVPFVRDGIFDHGRATAPRIPGPHMLPSTFPTGSASAIFGFRGSITHPTRSLCTLRDRRRRRPRNTRYRAPATAYPRRSSTGRTAPACLAHRKSKEIQPPKSGNSRSPDAQLRRPEEIQIISRRREPRGKSALVSRRRPPPPRHTVLAGLAAMGTGARRPAMTARVAPGVALQA